MLYNELVGGTHAWFPVFNTAGMRIENFSRRDIRFELEDHACYHWFYHRFIPAGAGTLIVCSFDNVTADVDSYESVV